MIELNGTLYHLALIPPLAWRTRATDRDELLEYVLTPEVERIKQELDGFVNVIAVFQAEPEEDSCVRLPLLEVAVILRHNAMTMVRYGKYEPTFIGDQPELPHRMWLASPQYNVTLQYHRIRKLNLLVD